MLEGKVALWWEKLDKEEQDLLITLLHSLDFEVYGITISAKGKYVKKFEKDIKERVSKVVIPA